MNALTSLLDGIWISVLEILSIANSLAEKYGYWVGVAAKITIAIAIGWPLFMLGIASWMTPEQAYHNMLLIAFFPLIFGIVAIFMTSSRNLGWGITVLAFVFRDRDIAGGVRRLKYVMLADLALGVYLSFIQPRGMWLLFFVVTAIFFASKWRKTVTLAFLALSCMCWLQTRTIAQTATMPLGYSSTTIGDPLVIPDDGTPMPAIRLASGGFHADVVIQRKISYEKFLQDEGDWIVVQCPGKSPSRLVTFNTQFEKGWGRLDGILDSCPLDFAVQGKGHLLIQVAE